MAWRYKKSGYIDDGYRQNHYVKISGFYTPLVWPRKTLWKSFIPFSYTGKHKITLDFIRYGSCQKCSHSAKITTHLNISFFILGERMNVHKQTCLLVNCGKRWDQWKSALVTWSADQLIAHMGLGLGPHFRAWKGCEVYRTEKKRQ